eukprot:1842847-Pleurochrysis_carterae.AAC.3
MDQKEQQVFWRRGSPPEQLVSPVCDAVSPASRARGRFPRVPTVFFRVRASLSHVHSFSGARRGGFRAEAKSTIQRGCCWEDCVEEEHPREHVLHVEQAGGGKVPGVRDARGSLKAGNLRLHEGRGDENRRHQGRMHDHSTFNRGALQAPPRTRSACSDVQPADVQRPGRRGLSSVFQVRGRRAGKLQGDGARAPAGAEQRWAQAVATDVPPTAPRLQERGVRGRGGFRGWGGIGARVGVWLRGLPRHVKNVHHDLALDAESKVCNTYFNGASMCYVFYACALFLFGACPAAC